MCIYIYYILLFRSSREAPASSALGTTCGGRGEREACVKRSNTATTNQKHFLSRRWAVGRYKKYIIILI